MSRVLAADRLTRIHPARGWGGHRVPPVTALDTVSLALKEGEGVALVGPSGSGKSTLLSLLLHLDRPTAGRVLLDGQPLVGVAAMRRLRRLVQYVPQDPVSTLDPRRTIARQVADPLKRLRVEGDHEAMVRDALRRVGLDEEILPRRAHQISGGQAQRVAIARALVTGPRLLLADEPVSGLDLPLRCQVLDLLDRLRREEGIGLLLVTHDLGAARQVCPYTHVMVRGCIVESGPTEDLLTAPQHPITGRLVAAIPRLAV